MSSGAETQNSYLNASPTIAAINPNAKIREAAPMINSTFALIFATPNRPISRA
jgi:hypothetical protein